MEFKEIVRKNFVLWTEALRTKDSQKVADLYSKEATFLPTVSAEFKLGKSGVEEYFEHFLKKNPEGEIKKEEIQPLG